MSDPTFTFELDEFELPLEEFETEGERGRLQSASRPRPRFAGGQRPRGPGRPNRPGHPHRPGPHRPGPHRPGPHRPGRRRWPIERIVGRPIAPHGKACPTVAVLEGYAESSIELEPHHEEMLKRLAEFLTSKTSVRGIEMIAWGTSSGAAGATTVRRLKKASQRLEELLKAANRSVPIRDSVRSTDGPERVDIRLCM